VSDALDLGHLREQLDRLEVVLRDLGCPPLPPGLSPREIERLTSPFGYPLPLEVSTLFEWHNGFGNWQPPMPAAPISLAHAVARTIAKRTEVEAAVSTGLDIDPDFVWPRSWLQMRDDPALGLVVDCALPANEPSPIMRPDFTDGDGYPQVVEPSLTQLIATWLHLFDTGVYGWDPETRLPTRNAPLPDELRLKGVY
jgi:hypothetical protein